MTIRSPARAHKRIEAILRVYRNALATEDIPLMLTCTRRMNNIDAQITALEHTRYTPATPKG